MAEGQKSLDEILDERSEAPAAEAEAPQGQPEAQEPAAEEAPQEGKPDQPRDDGGRFAKKGVDEGESPSPSERKAELSPEEYRVAKAERDRRQRVEAERDAERDEFKSRLETLNRELESLKQPKQPPAPPPSLWDDEQAWQTHLQQQVLQQADQISRINASEMAARSQHPDFQEMFDLFNRLAEENPSIVKQAMTDPHPWGKAYQIARNHVQMQELGATNLDELRAKIREELLAEAQANVPTPKPNAPPTLTTERNVGSRSGPAWGGPKPLNELLS